jgi:parallel beta-helix repeat protein
MTLTVRHVKASSTIYILQNGSINPPTAPIIRNGNVYTLIDDIEDSIIVQRDNIILDGTGHSLFGFGTGAGIGLYNVTNATIVNLKVHGFNIGIDLHTSANITIAECLIHHNTNHGVMVYRSPYTNIFGNIIEFNLGDGIRIETYSIFNQIGHNHFFNNSMIGINLYLSSYNTIIGNNILINGMGIVTSQSDNTSIIDNLMEGCTGGGIRFEYSAYSLVSGNTMLENGWHGLFFGNSSDNTVYHNNFINNSNPIYLVNSGLNYWDLGYPIGGNFWSDDAGEDFYRGPYQNVTGYDGISDSPYYYDDSPLDNYPLMGTVGPATREGQNITVFPLEELSMVFDSIIEEGETWASRQETGYAPPEGDEMLLRYEIETTATASGDILLRVVYDEPGESPLQQGDLRLLLINGILGDVDYDFDVDIFDIVMIAGAYGTYFEHPEFNPQADLDKDGDVDIFDIVIAAGNYGMSVPSHERYTDITTHVDTENKVIFGLAPHLSVYGVTRRS